MFWYLAGFVCIIGSVVCAPNHLKTVVVEANKDAGVYNGVGASVAAEAGVGHTSGGVVASAPESSGVAGAGAGAGGVGATFGASVGFGAAPAAVPNGPTFFDRIFNIPISILHSVNDHLNTRGAVRKGVVVQVAAGGEAAAAPASPGAAASASSSAGAHAGAAAGAAAGPGPEAHGDAGFRSGVAVAAEKRPGFYDGVFNIPITALKSVNQLLNG